MHNHADHPPLDAADVLARGMIFHGRTVRRFVIEWDGGRLETALPTPGPVPARSSLHHRVVEVLRASDIPLTRKQLAARLGRKGIAGRFSSAVRESISRGEVFEQGGDLADTRAKFAAATAVTH